MDQKLRTGVETASSATPNHPTTGAATLRRWKPRDQATHIRNSVSMYAGMCPAHSRASTAWRGRVLQAKFFSAWRSGSSKFDRINELPQVDRLAMPSQWRPLRRYIVFSFTGNATDLLRENLESRRDLGVSGRLSGQRNRCALPEACALVSLAHGRL